MEGIQVRLKVQLYFIRSYKNKKELVPFQWEQALFCSYVL